MTSASDRAPSATLVNREQFLTLMGDFGFTSREDIRMLHKLFSSFDVSVRDQLNLPWFCRVFHMLQREFRALNPRCVDSGDRKVNRLAMMDEFFELVYRHDT